MHSNNNKNHYYFIHGWCRMNIEECNVTNINIKPKTNTLNSTLTISVCIVVYRTYSTDGHKINIKLNNTLTKAKTHNYA